MFGHSSSEKCLNRMCEDPQHSLRKCLLTVVKIATMNTGRQQSVQDSAFYSSEYIPVSRIAGSFVF